MRGNPAVGLLRQLALALAFWTLLGGHWVYALLLMVDYFALPFAVVRLNRHR